MAWLTPTDYNMAYSGHVAPDDECGLELNSAVRFDNAVLGRAMLEAGVGIMLLREEHAEMGAAQGMLALSPLARAEFPVIMAHVAGRENDPLIHTFMEAAASV